MNEYGSRYLSRSPYTGRSVRSLDSIGWSACFDPEPGFWRRVLTWICGH